VENGRYLTIPEVAKRTGLSVRWLADECRAGRIEHIYIARKRRFTEEQFARLMAQHTIIPAEQTQTNDARDRAVRNYERRMLRSWPIGQLFASARLGAVGEVNCARGMRRSSLIRPTTTVRAPNLVRDTPRPKRRGNRNRRARQVCAKDRRRATWSNLRTCSLPRWRGMTRDSQSSRSEPTEARLQWGAGSNEGFSTAVGGVLDVV
jgi:hypothetical protein